VVLYLGDGARNECVYKFVSEREYDPCRRHDNLRLLERGTLYVAKLEVGGTGQWLPLRYSDEPLTDANGFHSQGEILANARGAADQLGATKVAASVEIAEESGDAAAVLLRWHFAAGASHRLATLADVRFGADRAIRGQVELPPSAA
jgi:secreted PhoX family phosphatase